MYAFEMGMNLVITAAICAISAYLCGKSLTETKIIGGGLTLFRRGGLAIVAIGATWVYFTLWALIIAPSSYAAQFLFWLAPAMPYFVMVSIFMGIMTHYEVRAWRDHRFGGKDVGEWCNVPGIRNTWYSAATAPGVVKQYIEYLREDEDDELGEEPFPIIRLLFSLILGAGIFATLAIARWADRRNAKVAYLGSR